MFFSYIMMCERMHPLNIKVRKNSPWISASFLLTHLWKNQDIDTDIDCECLAGRPSAVCSAVVAWTDEGVEVNLVLRSYWTLAKSDLNRTDAIQFNPTSGSRMLARTGLASYTATLESMTRWLPLDELNSKQTNRRRRQQLVPRTWSTKEKKHKWYPTFRN